MQSKPNFKLLTPFWSGCQQQNLSKNLLWVAGCLSNKLTLICQGVFKLASNAALLCKSLAFVCEIKIIVKASNKSQIHRLPDLHPPSPQKRVFDGEIGVKFLYPWLLPLLLAVSCGFWACFGRRYIPSPQSIAIGRMIRTIRNPPGPVGLSATGLR